MVRVLPPWHVNLGKRLVKRPKIYLRDSGLLHTLMLIRDVGDLSSHNKLGASWEGFALERVLRALNLAPERFYFWATHAGAELDLLWWDRGKNWGVEFKYADAPALGKSMKIAVEDLSLSHLWVVYPGAKRYRLSGRITVLPLAEASAQRPGLRRRSASAFRKGPPRGQ